MIYLELLICLMLLIAIYERLYVAVEYLRSIASSTSEVDRQLVAFIHGGYTDGRGAEDHDVELNLKHLDSWGYLGWRVYSNHASWFARNKERSGS